MDKVEMVYSILSKNEKYYSIKLSDDTTRLLDLLLAMSDCEKFREFLQNLADIDATIPLDSPFWPGCTTLHLAVYMSKNTKLWYELFIQSDSQENLDSFLQVHESIGEDKMEYQKRIDICLESGCSVDIKNADGLTPIYVAFKLCKTNIINLLLNKCEINCDDSSDLSFLHIACAVGNLDVVKRLLDRGADINSQTKANFECQDQINSWKFRQIPANSTVLHIATILKNESMVQFLLNMGADVYAKNALGMTPIHSSILSNQSIAQFLLKKPPVLTDSVMKCGLSHLHIAAFADDANAIEKLLQWGANIDRVWKTTKAFEKLFSHRDNPIVDNNTPLNVALDYKCKNAITTLLKNGSDILQQCANHGILLQYLLRNLDITEVKNCIENKLKPDQRFDEAIDANGTTLLHVACYMLDYEWAEKLLKEGADVNAKIQKSPGWDEYENWTGSTPMHLLIYRIFDYDDRDDKKINGLAKLLIKNGADLLAINEINQSPLLLARDIAHVDPCGCCYHISKHYGLILLPIADLLLRSQSTYSVNPASSDGFSHFHYACMRNEVDVVNKFLKNGIDINLVTNINFEDYPDAHFTPLHLALYCRSEEVACLLIERGANVKGMICDEDEDAIDSPLHIAIERDLVDSYSFEMLLSHGANVNARSEVRFESTPFQFFLERGAITHKQFKLFRKYGASVNLGDDLFGLAITNAKPCDREAIFEELIDLCDVNNAVKNKISPIESIVQIVHSGQLTLSFYLNAIQRFINMGCKLDQQNKEGDTALHMAKRHSNLVAIEALLLLGANVNITNNNEEPALHEENDRSSERIQKLLAAHVWKMKLVNLKIHKLCSAAMLKIHQEYPLDQDQQQLCEDELAKLSEESASIRKFLSEWGAAIDYPTMSFIQRENVDKFFSKFDELRQNYPQFAGLLMNQYRKALDRFEMHNIAMDLLPSVLQVELPYLCLENILKYFDNYELSYFVTGQRSGRKIYVRIPGDSEGKRKYVQVTI